MRRFFILSFILVFLSKPAFAYLDPGSASLALQAILAVLVGGLATMKFWWARFKSFFKKPPEREDESDSL